MATSPFWGTTLWARIGTRFRRTIPMSLRNPWNNPQLTYLHSSVENNGPFRTFLWSDLVPCLAVSMPESKIAKIVGRLLALLDSMHVKAKQLNGVMGLLRYKTELRALEQTYMKLQSQSQLQAQALQQLQLLLSSTEQDKRVAHERLDTMSSHYQSALCGAVSRPPPKPPDLGGSDPRSHSQ